MHAGKTLMHTEKVNLMREGMGRKERKKKEERKKERKERKQKIGYRNRDELFTIQRH